MNPAVEVDLLVFGDALDLVPMKNSNLSLMKKSFALVDVLIPMMNSIRNLKMKLKPFGELARLDMAVVQSHMLVEAFELGPLVEPYESERLVDALENAVVRLWHLNRNSKRMKKNSNWKHKLDPLVSAFFPAS